MKSKRFLPVLIVVFGILFCLNFVFAAFGISPPFVLNDHLSPGSHFEQKIVLSRDKPEQNLRVELIIDAPEIDGWITIDKGLSFVLPKGQQQVSMQVLVDVPEDAEFGSYKGKIAVRTIPEKSEEGMVTIALGGEIRIELTVTEKKISEFKVLTCDIPDSEEGEPIKLLMKIDNTGNIATAPSRIHLDVYDRYHRELLESGDDADLDLIEPLKTKEIYAQFPTKLGISSYWGEIKIFKDEEIVRGEKIYFNIIKGGVLAVSTEKIGNWFQNLSSRFPLLYFYVGAGVILLLLVGLLIWVERKKRKMTPQNKKTMKRMDIKNKNNTRIKIKIKKL